MDVVDERTWGYRGYFRKTRGTVEDDREGAVVTGPGRTFPAMTVGPQGTKGTWGGP